MGRNPHRRGVDHGLDVTQHVEFFERAVDLRVLDLADRGTDEILGVHVCGPMAGELIAEAVVAMEFQASAEDLQRTIHGHPTLSEAIHEAALAVDKRAIHAINR